MVMDVLGTKTKCFFRWLHGHGQMRPSLGTIFRESPKVQRFDVLKETTNMRLKGFGIDLLDSSQQIHKLISSSAKPWTCLD